MKKHRRYTLLRRVGALSAAVGVLAGIYRTAGPSALPAGFHTGERLAEGLLMLELAEPPAEDDLSVWAKLLAVEAPVMAVQPEPLASEPESEPEPEPETAGNAAEPVSAPPPEPEPESEPEPEEPPAEESAEPASEEPAPLDLSKVKGSDIKLDNHTAGLHPDPANYLKKDIPLTLKSAEKGPQILIMHTHTTEAYAMDGEDVYQESDPARTTDNNYNMVRVGEEMKAVFEEMGLSVVHDTTAYDYPGYNGSYGRSLAGIQAYLEKYPTIQVVLDVHRDALIDSKGTVYAKTADIDGEKTAQVMLVVGTNDGGLTHPDWKNHFNLAVHLQAAMLAVNPKLPREIDLRAQRFNQHVTPGSLLVEVGTSGNTLKEALAGARLFARAAGEVYVGRVE